MIWDLLNNIGIGLKVVNLINYRRRMRRKVLIGKDMTNAFDVASELRESFAEDSFLLVFYFFFSFVLWL